MKHDLSGDLHLQKEKCTFWAVIYTEGKKKKKKKGAVLWFFFLLF